MQVSRRKIRDREMIQSARGVVTYPLPIGERPQKSKSKLSAIYRVRLAYEHCPQGTRVRFALNTGETMVAKTGITKSNPYYEDGVLYVAIAGSDKPFRFDRIRVV